MTTTYERRKAQGLCPLCTTPVLAGQVLCQPCCDAQAEYRDRLHTARERADIRMQAIRRLFRPLSDPPQEGPLVAHCNRFHPVAALPWSCPDCGQAVLKEMPPC
jgi:hypothetical protein